MPLFQELLEVSYSIAKNVIMCRISRHYCIGKFALLDYLAYTSCENESACTDFIDFCEINIFNKEIK